MPITSERMMQALEIAQQAVEKYGIAKKKLKEIANDISSLQERLNKKEINDEMIDDLMWTMTSTIRDAQEMCHLPEEMIQNLGYETAWFNINQSKNKNAANRMRILRGGIRKRGFKPRRRARGNEVETEQDYEQDYDDNDQPDPYPREQRLSGEEIIERLAKARRGEEVREIKSPVAEMLEAQNKLKKKWGDKIEELTQSQSPFHAARSEQIPTQDDEQSWLPKARKQE